MIKRLGPWAAAAIAAVSVCATVPAGAADAPGPLPPAADRKLAREIFKELVEMKTTHDLGSTAAAQAIRQRLIDGGFAPGDVLVIAPDVHPNKGNVVVRYHGRRASGREARLRPVLFMGHLDVVEAKAEDWSVDPFKMTEKDGWFYGRGTIDMKEGDAALVETLLRFKREQFTPDRDLIVALTADEEAGGDSNGPAFLLAHHRELIDAELAVNLDGGGGVFKDGKRLYFNVMTSEKTYVTYNLETTSPGGHGSLPGPDNAIYRLADGLGRLERYRFPVVTNATTRASFAKLADLLPSANSDDMRAVAKPVPDAAAGDRLSENVGFNAWLRTTCVATLISGGHAENALPQRANATIQCRMMPGDDAETVQAVLTSVLADPKIRIVMNAPPIISPESPPTLGLMARVEGVVHSMWPGVPIVPGMSTGFSDDRQTRNAGIPSYDLSGVWADIDENRTHGRDERIGVRAFDENIEYTYRLVKAMSRAK